MRRLGAGLGCQGRDDVVQVAEGAGGGDVVGVVAGLDDHAVADPGDENDSGTSVQGMTAGR